MLQRVRGTAEMGLWCQVPWEAYENRYVSLVETSTNRHDRMLADTAKLTNQQSGMRARGHGHSAFFHCQDVLPEHFGDTLIVAYQTARQQNRITSPTEPAAAILTSNVIIAADLISHESRQSPRDPAVTRYWRNKWKPTAAI